MEWVIENWFWIMFFVIFIGMHLFGHGGMHGGHGGEEGDEHKGHSGEGQSEKKGGSACH